MEFNSYIDNQQINYEMNSKILLRIDKQKFSIYK